MEVLSILVKEYENEHCPMPSPNRLQAIKFRLDQIEMSEKELNAILGYHSRKSGMLIKNKYLEEERLVVVFCLEKSVATL